MIPESASLLVFLALIPVGQVLEKESGTWSVEFCSWGNEASNGIATMKPTGIRLPEITPG